MLVYVMQAISVIQLQVAQLLILCVASVTIATMVQQTCSNAQLVTSDQLLVVSNIQTAVNVKQGKFAQAIRTLSIALEDTTVLYRLQQLSHAQLEPITTCLEW